jgi:hypothetical protein
VTYRLAGKIIYVNTASMNLYQEKVNAKPITIWIVGGNVPANCLTQWGQIMTEKQSIALSSLATALKNCKLAGIETYAGNVYDTGNKFLIIVMPKTELVDGKLVAKEDK